MLIAQRHLGDLFRGNDRIKALRLAAQSGKACRCGMTGGSLQLLHGFKIVFRGSFAQCAQHTAGELEGRCGGKHHHGHALTLFLCSHMESHSGVGIAQVAILFVAGTDLPCHLVLAAPAAGEGLLNGGQRLGTDGVAAGGSQLLHKACYLASLPVTWYSRRSRLEDTRMSMLGEVVLKNSRFAV